ncbi:hypothetical protein D3C71_524290 [compost metagenome]
MKTRAISLMNLVFFVPAILLSWFVWNDYSRYMTNINDHLASMKGIYFLDEGRKVVGISDQKDGAYYRAHLFDASTGTLLKETTILSSFYGELGAVSYQQGGVIVPTYDSSLGLQLNYFRPSGEMDELAQGTLHVPSFMSSGVYSWRGRLIITGETIGSALYMAQVKGGEVGKLLLSSPGLLPARPVRVTDVHGSFTNDKALPIFEVSLKDDRTAFVSGILDKNNKPSVLIKNKDENTFDAEDRAAAQFGKHFGFDNAKLIRTDGDYPEKARFYNANEKRWGAAVPTPKPVYQSRVFLLNDQEVLIAGSTAEDELKGTVLGYVFNQKTGKFADVTGFLSKLSYEDLKNDNMTFHKELDKENLYFVNEDQGAGSYQMKNHDIKIVTNKQVGLWMAGEGGDRISWRSFWNYVKQGGALIINWVVWLVIPLFMFVGLGTIPRLLMRSRARKIAEGQQIPGTIVRMEETGLQVNNQPQVRFTVQFEDDGQMKEVEIKKVISFLSDVKVGDPVMISYNKSKNRAVFVTQEDIPGSQKLEVIRNAELRRIEPCGKVKRSQVLQLHFTANGRDYTVPVVQPPGFEYRVGERANLALIQGTARIHSYGNGDGLAGSEQISMQGEVLRVEEYPVSIAGRQLMTLEIMMTEGPERIRKVNSLFVPKGLPVQAGVVIPVVMRRDDYAKEARLHKGKQGAAKVISVRFTGTIGERPLAEITVERDGTTYHISQTIEPVYGVETGDELWIAYDENTREAVIVNYAS